MLCIPLGIPRCRFISYRFITYRFIDLPQVDLMNFRVEYVKPRSDRCLGREAAERATKSREVDLRPAGTE